MKLTLRERLMQFGHLLQDKLFPVLEEAVGKLNGPAQRLVSTLAMVPLARFVPASRGWIGRPSKDRYAIACAFVAKAVYGFTDTRQLIEQLHADGQLRGICGWPAARRIPHESTFSRAFAEFAQMELAQFVHAALIADTQADRLIGHIARDSSAVEARERFPETKAQRLAKKAAQREQRSEAKRGRKPGPRGPHKRHKGGKPKYTPPSNTRLHRQRTATLDAMLKELPRQCGLGVKTAHDGNQKYWRGYKLHLDVADGQIPISAILTSASLHDSQVAIPLATMTAQRITNLYDVMDSAYDSTEIMEHSRSFGHVPIVKPVKRMRKLKFGFACPARELSWAEEDRFRERTMVERVYARWKDEFGGRNVRVRGAAKVMAHAMFGILALTADQIRKLAT